MPTDVGGVKRELECLDVECGRIWAPPGLGENPVGPGPGPFGLRAVALGRPAAGPAALRVPGAGFQIPFGWDFIGDFRLGICTVRTSTMSNASSRRQPSWFWKMVAAFQGFFEAIASMI